ncbi:hypothetical protein KFE25_013299 [Diacronema lutheri]|uniref:protein O-GlcNAc transferase n=1 Tax=Diacronema lutheri TaxID=2081491 RepID=A0A8J6CEK9_DIALT|nr:hypothetical protein KFE25_013299 [Diacronema lutheri]
MAGACTSLVLVGLLGLLEPTVDELLDAVRRRPRDPAARFYLGNALVAAQRLDEAHVAFRAAAALAGDVPDAAVAWLNLGNLEGEAFGNHSAALRAYGRCLQLQPRHAQCELNRGNTFTRLERLGEARDAYARAVAATGGEWGEAAEALATADRRLMHWRDFAQSLDSARARLAAELRARRPGERLSAQPFGATFDAGAHSPADARVIAAAAAEAIAHGVRAEPLGRMPAAAALRVAIVHSSPWRSQIAPHLEALLYAHRTLARAGQRAQVELSVWSSAARWPPPQGNESLAPRAAQVWAELHEDGRLVQLPVGAAAASRFAPLCRGPSRPHALVLMSALGDADADRALFARRCAPVQALWLDWPGTSGARWLDSMLLDAAAVLAPSPALAQSAFAERLVLLPHSLYVNGHALRPVLPAAIAVLPAAIAVLPAAIAAVASAREPPPLTRAAAAATAAGLPHRWAARGLAIVASRNLAQKADPAVMDDWAGVLSRSPHAALWLFAAPLEAERAQLREAAVRGLPLARLHTSGRVPRQAHGELLASACLWLDTFAYGAHSTGTDVIHAALPAVALAGVKLASRLFPSMLCGAAGACELVARSHREYADLATELLRNRRRENR